MLNTNDQDMFSADYRVYIEGVQVPFESVQISNIYRQAPVASITLPPWPGLQDLGRNYNPKIDIFWRDHNLAPTPEQKGVDEMRDAYKVLFSGIITSSSDAKSMGTDGGSQSISLTCKHPIQALNEILIRFGNQAVTSAQAQIDPNASGALQRPDWDINTMMIQALKGVKKGLSEGYTHYVPDHKFEELQGTPGILYVMWNTLKRDANRDLAGRGDAAVLKDLYIPLIEKGLKFWERMTGHPEIEKGIQSENSRVKYGEKSAVNGVDAKLEGKIMVPAAFRSFLGNAAQKEMAIAATTSLMQGMGSPEATSFGDHIDMLLSRLEYEMAILSSPVSKADGRTYEYIIKPETPTYYAPICNVVLPNMLTDVSVNNDYEMVPTRTVNLSNLVAFVGGAQSGGVPDQQYTAPHSVRYARAKGAKGTLGKSLSAFNNVAGRYECGSGVRARITHLPALYNLMRVKVDKKVPAEEANGQVVGEKDHENAKTAWDKMYPESKWPGASSYNPLGSTSGISSFNRLNFMYADQQFANEVHKARTAQASGIFNPYAVVGYPMDFVDSTPSRESYHGLCTSVSHSIHAGGSATTSYGMSGVSTLSELALYNIPAVNPYLSSVFDFSKDARLYMNDTAYKKACKVYLDVFGIGAAEPALLQDFHTGSPVEFTRLKDSGCWTTEEVSRMQNTVQGSLLLVARNIRTLLEMDAEREAEGLSPYIDIAHWYVENATEDTPTSSVTKVEIDGNGVKILTPGLDAESSPFLDYTRSKVK